MECKVFTLELSIRAWKYLDFFLVALECAWFYVVYLQKKERMPSMPLVHIADDVELGAGDLRIEGFGPCVSPISAGNLELRVFIPFVLKDSPRRRLTKKLRA